MSANQTILSVELLNTIRAEASAQYQDSVPEATRDNIADVGASIQAYDPMFNEFSRLLAKIAKTVSLKRFYQNPLAIFKKEKLETANMIEEYFIRKIKSQLQDYDGENSKAPRRPTFSITYHKENRRETYHTTTSFKQLRSSFRSRDGVESVMNEIVSSMLSDAQIDEFRIMSELIKKAVDGSFTVVVDNPLESEAKAKSLVKAIRTASNTMERPSSLYHNATVIDPITELPVKDENIITFTPKKNQVLFLRTDVEAQLDVEVLAMAFNMGKTDTSISRIITLDDLGEGVVALLADEDLFVIHDTFEEMLTEVNAKGAFTNYFLHVDQLLALSPYANVAVFKHVPAEPDFDNGTDGAEVVTLLQANVGKSVMVKSDNLTAYGVIQEGVDGDFNEGIIGIVVNPAHFIGWAIDNGVVDDISGFFSQAWEAYII